MNATAEVNRITPLWIAARNGNVDVVEKLLEYQAKLTATHTNGTTPLHVAAQHGHVQVVKRLLREYAKSAFSNSGAYIGIVDVEGNTAVLAAARAGRFAVVEALLYAGVSARVRATDGATLLTLAAQQRHMKAVTRLFKF